MSAVESKLIVPTTGFAPKNGANHGAQCPHQQQHDKQRSQYFDRLQAGQMVFAIACARGSA